MKAYILYYISGILFAIAGIINVINDPKKISAYLLFVAAAAMIFAGIANYKKMNN
ncbi:MAG TPA: DUF3953 domain-containing protein [Chitinophagaceae bacterium]|nr:DUF3953 domain-containing protein [Chitinophagaceae bacterium]